MPLRVEQIDRNHYIVVVNKDNMLWCFGYAGELSMADVSNVVTGLAGGNVVAMPGASERCFLFATEVVWFVLTSCV